MTKHFQNYIWKEGIPYGLNFLEIDKIKTDQTTYKIIMDPYKKRISIEKYRHIEFISLIYDSFLLDFRTLKHPEHTAWQKTILKDTPDRTRCLIRNQDDRIVFLEECLFEKNFCRECRVISPHGFLLSIHKMYYQALNDSFDGVRLYDANEQPVMQKRYTIDEKTGEFSQLISEHWETGKGL